MKLFGRKTAVLPPRDQVTRVYTRSGRIAHLMMAGESLCPFGPAPAEAKGITGEEAISAAAMPLCTFCREVFDRMNAGGFL